MALTTRQMARLSELLDSSLPLPTEQRRAWLDSLSGEDRSLVENLREILLADDPESGALGSIRPIASAFERRAGERLGAYELLSPLGSGGMAEVWLARRADGVFERQVALKIPRLRQVPEEMAQRFAQECRILATLECPGIARLYDAGVGAGGVPYIAMERVQGQPLLDWCAARGLDTAARVELFARILDAVGRAHARGIVHRDLKPSNILVSESGEPCLLDFGVAGLLETTPDRPSLTRTYGRALTPEYASPEMLRGEAIDIRSDIYSLGVVLHEMLTGVRPVRPDGVEKERLTPRLRAILDEALAPSPADRFADATVFAAALRASGPVARERKPRFRVMQLAAAALLVGLAGAATYYWMNRDVAGASSAQATPPERAQATIAVLPFEDLSEGRDHSYLSDGLAEELIDLLTKVPKLRVTARASSFAFRDGTADLSTIARRLNVDHLLEGSVRTSGQRLKFTVQLVRASDATVVWSQTYDREMKDVFEIQEDVASAVVAALKLHVLDGGGVESERRTGNVRAYAEYLLGRQYRDGASRERNERAKAAFERAAALDPGFAPARAGIALAAADIAGATMSNEPYDLALTEAERAMALAPRLTEAYVARAQVRMGRNWDFVGAKADLDVAMGIDPNNIELLQAYASYSWMTGNLDDALEIQRRLVVLNPLASKTWDWLGLILMDSRDLAGAREAFARSAELSPYSDYRYLLNTLVELHAGNDAEALRLARANPIPDFRDYAVALAAFSAGQAAESEAALQRLTARSADRAAAQIAIIHAWKGNREKAFEWLEKAVALRDPGLFGMQYRPEFDEMRDDPRFERVLRMMNVGK